MLLILEGLQEASDGHLADGLSDMIWNTGQAARYGDK